MWDFIVQTFGSGFMPHGHCYLWTPSMVWLQVVSNALVGAAYVTISLTLYYIVQHIKDIPFSWIYVAFGVFILACGATHFSDVITVWHPIYWIDGGLRAITAIASVGTAVLLLRLVPKVRELASASRIAHERGVQLEASFTELQAAHEKAKHMERFIACEVTAQTNELTRELVSLRMERDALKRALSG